MNKPKWMVKWNWRTTLFALAQALLWMLFIIAYMPYEFGKLAEVFNPEWKLAVMKFSGAAFAFLMILRGTISADAHVVNSMQKKLSEVLEHNAALAEKLKIDQRTPQAPPEEP